MRFLKVAFMLILAVDILIIFIAFFLLSPVLVLISIAISGILKGIHNQHLAKHKLNHLYQNGAAYRSNHSTP